MPVIATVDSKDPELLDGAITAEEMPTLRERQNIGPATLRAILNEYRLRAERHPRDAKSAWPLARSSVPAGATTDQRRPGGFQLRIAASCWSRLSASTGSGDWPARERIPSRKMAT